MTMQLIWLRTDLRIHDNTALTAAMQQGPTVAIYLVSPAQWQQHDDAACKVDFWLRNLVELKQALGELNVPLLIREADTWSKAPEVLLEVCQQQGIKHLHVNDEYGINETNRDRAVQAALQGALDIASDAIPEQVNGFPTPSQTLRDLWPAGEDEAHRRLKDFADEQISFYKDERDLPAKPGTSQLSAYLAAGVISPRQCLHAALRNNSGEFETGDVGAVTWINELLWR